MSSASVQILLVEDNTADAVLMKRELADSAFGPFAVAHVKRLAEAIDRIQSGGIDAVMLDLGLPDSQGISTFREMQKYTRRDIPIVVLTGLHDDALGVAALKDGAADYLTKGVAADSIRARAVRYAIERKHADEAFLISQQRLARAVDAAQMGIFEWDLQTGEVVRIHNSKHLYGREPREMEPTYEGFNRCLHPDDRATTKKGIQHSFASHEDFYHECRTIWPDESVHWIELRACSAR
jgi:two-component system sensor histidine kinase UhpB